MPLLGAHMSMAGGYYKAVEAAAEHDMQCVQIFTKNNNQWRAKPISDDDQQRFELREEFTAFDFRSFFHVRGYSHGTRAYEGLLIPAPAL